MIPRFLILFLLLLPVAHAVGFMNMPQQREIVFEPNGHVEIPLTVVNGQYIGASISTPGEAHPETLGTPQDDNILEYARIIDNAPRTGPRTVTLAFDFPQQLRPGFYLVDVYATDYPTNTEGAMVSAVATTRLRFTVRVLNAEKLAEITALGVPPIAEGLQANGTVTVVSRTEQDIDRVQAELFVYKGEELVATARTGAAPLPSAGAVSLSAILPTEELPGGEYLMNASVTYDGAVISSHQEILKIGTLHVTVPEYTRQVTYNTTNRFLFNISNEWNRELQEVYAFTTFGGQVKKTASQDIPPFGRTEYEVYFDRDEALQPGSANVNITISFKDYDPKTKAYVLKEETFLHPVQVVLPPVPEQLSMQQVLTYGIIGLLAILLIVAILLLLRKTPPAAPASPPPSSPPPQ